MVGNSTEVRLVIIHSERTYSTPTVSRLYAKSNNYDMDLTLDYNIELFPLKKGDTFTLALASSLSRGGPATSIDGSTEEDEKDRPVWRPDGKGSRGLEEDYDYVMYGKVVTFRCFRALSGLLNYLLRSTNLMGVLQKLCKLMLSCRNLLSRF
jgi:hypothetical protein